MTRQVIRWAAMVLMCLTGCGTNPGSVDANFASATSDASNSVGNKSNHKTTSNEDTTMTHLPFLAGHGGRSTQELIQLEEHYRIDSIVLAFESALHEKSKLAEPERVILAVEALEREVNNGGFNQFFLNSSNQHAYFVAKALRLIGCPETAKLCDQALAAISNGEVLDADQLNARAANASEELDTRLDELDAIYYQSHEEPIAERLFAYIKTNRAAITTGT